MSEKDWKMHTREWVRKPADTEAEGAAADRFTVLTYNILHTGYQGPDGYRYCPEEIRYLDGRHPHIMIEIQTMNPDIVCLQEVSSTYYRDSLLPDLIKQGYDGYVAVDEQQHRVGQATFWKQDKFKSITNEKHMFHDKALSYLNKSSLSDEIKKSLEEWLTCRSLLNLVHLQHITSNKSVIVGNVHISYGGYQLPCLQAIQVSLAAQQLDSSMQHNDPKAAVLMLGDFNVWPDHPVYSFTSSGVVDDDLKKSLRDQTNWKNILSEGELQHATDILDLIPQAFYHHLKIQSAYKQILGEEPEATNADDSDMRIGILPKCLDYIWYSTERLRVTGTLRAPSMEDILKYTALPSLLFPSDHLPIMAEFAFVH